MECKQCSRSSVSHSKLFVGMEYKCQPLRIQCCHQNCLHLSLSSALLLCLTALKGESILPMAASRLDLSAIIGVGDST